MGSINETPALKSKQTIFIFTNEYPYGTRESFIENELKLLAECFQTIYLLPLKATGQARAIPLGNVKVVSLFTDEYVNKWKLLLNNFFSFFQILLYEAFSTRHPLKFLKHFSEFKSILLINIYRASVLKKFIQHTNNQDALFYSFWTDNWATTLSILKKKNFLNFVSRVHGYDLYEERWPDSIIPFRSFQIQSVSKIFAVSRDGLLYLQQHYPSYKNKFYLNHLSVFDNGINPFKEAAVFTIVSCSHLIPLKRVHLLAEALCKINFQMKWVHFGDGEEMELVRSIVKRMPAHIIAELKGNTPNEEIIRFYQQQTVNLFIHLSETEGGVPIVLQDAASFGIPLIGTRVGGIVEIVNEQTGILIDKMVNIEKLAELITEEFRFSSRNALDFRASVRNFWQNSFDAKKNVEEFVNLLKTIQ
jgi:glycosyltransferase involved in cell wall biosynthesis